MRTLWLIPIVMLAGCAKLQTAADTAARDQAKNSVSIVVANKLPGANVEKVTDCIIDSATAQELLKLSAATLTGVDATTIDLVGQISARPEALKCMAQNALAVF